MEPELLGSGRLDNGERPEVAGRAASPLAVDRYRAEPELSA